MRKIQLNLVFTSKILTFAQNNKIRPHKVTSCQRARNTYIKKKRLWTLVFGYSKLPLSELMAKNKTEVDATLG